MAPVTTKVEFLAPVCLVKTGKYWKGFKSYFLKYVLFNPETNAWGASMVFSRGFLCIFAQSLSVQTLGDEIREKGAGFCSDL